MKFNIERWDEIRWRYNVMIKECSSVQYHQSRVVRETFRILIIQRPSYIQWQWMLLYLNNLFLFSYIWSYFAEEIWNIISVEKICAFFVWMANSLILDRDTQVPLCFPCFIQLWQNWMNTRQRQVIQERPIHLNFLWIFF